MNFLSTIYTDIGTSKSTNQDSAFIKVANTDHGRVMMAIVCDGMGGLAKGELASATVVKAFSHWFTEQFPATLYADFSAEELRQQWEDIIQRENTKIMDYGKAHGVSLGTTVSILLIVNHVYYVLNVGDSRTYEIADNQMLQITYDHTVVAREISLGNLTEEQAKNDPRRSILLQCVGASNVVVPDFFTGQARSNAVYMLCSDGFRHEITSSEIFENLHANILIDETTMRDRATYLVELNKSRNEIDNITVALVRTY